MLRGATIRIVNIINRQFSENAKHILRQFYAVPMEVKEREGWEQVQFSMLTPGYSEVSNSQGILFLAKKPLVYKGLFWAKIMSSKLRTASKHTHISRPKWPSLTLSVAVPEIAKG